MSRVIRWGLLSAGNIVSQFARDFSVVENAVIHAVAARNGENARAFAREHGIANAYEGYEALLADPEIDAIYIGTPHNLHFEHAKVALEHGKAVLCEKPMTVTPQECEQLQSVAEHRGGYLMEAMWTYFLPPVQKALRWVQEGRIGRVCHIKADFGYPQFPYDSKKRVYDASLAGGCLLEMGVYPVALAWLFMQQDPTDIQVMARFAPNGVEDDLSVLFNYPESVAILGTSFRCKLQNWAYIIGDEGYIAIPDFWRAREASLHVLDDRVDHFVDERATDGFHYEAQAMTNDLLAGRAGSSVVTARDSLAIQRQMAMIREAFADDA
ncbi:Gfo/Idh/MocA family oxidoreductase [Gilvimarinus sp. SDUM040013]|uniref:Gfo/Idh/MocA family oxidoreductase n=1 Tax=Gilvimarinus gilvus TaxID=3058038 RepID=A0ABU4S266_9GAMM|nr:Gfo/Idh/MocA family oxidoreductase [Gilvimarinus sp. SDUM040013]MDO3385901.1 Gfo/Idh/MocA family oxidoreductase [Gilvimarinus sp. SDUM040013]MDX6850596.1 Gfo/Idh/MocA family oxidoreductase [Gilvimarinus sp. SDUM040013]